MQLLNKIGYIILVFIAILTVSYISSVALADINQIHEFDSGCGDGNQSGSVNVLDVILQLQIVVELHQPDEVQVILLDINQDGDINIIDVIFTLRSIVGLGELTECGKFISVEAWQEQIANEILSELQSIDISGDMPIDDVFFFRWTTEQTAAVVSIDYETIPQEGGNFVFALDDIIVSDQRVWTDHGEDYCLLNYLFLISGKGRMIWVIRCYDGDEYEEVRRFIDQELNPIIERLTWYPLHDQGPIGFWGQLINVYLN